MTCNFTPERPMANIPPITGGDNTVMIKKMKNEQVRALARDFWGEISQQTITYKFRSNSEGYDYYKRYFDELWNNKEFAKEL